MFAGYIIRDLNQSHYIRGGSEMEAKFFTSELLAKKGLKTLLLNLTVSLYHFNFLHLLLSHLLFFLTASHISFSTLIFLITPFSSFYFNSHFFTCFFGNSARRLLLYFTFYVFEHFYLYLTNDIFFFYPLIFPFTCHYLFLSNSLFLLP